MLSRELKHMTRKLKYNQNFMTRVAKAREWVMDFN